MGTREYHFDYTSKVTFLFWLFLFVYNKYSTKNRSIGMKRIVCAAKISCDYRVLMALKSTIWWSRKSIREVGTKIGRKNHLNGKNSTKKTSQKKTNIHHIELDGTRLWLSGNNFDSPNQNVQYFWHPSWEMIVLDRWAPGYPSSDREHCVYLSEGSWTNEKCETENRFFCEKYL